MFNRMYRATVGMKSLRRFIKKFLRKRYSSVNNNHPNLDLYIIYRFLMGLYEDFEAKRKIFDTICIQTYVGCNYNCPFCPANKPKLNLYGGALQGAKMEMGLYKFIVGQLSELKFRGRISLAAMNEPLMDERIVELVSLIRKKCPLSFIFIQTNGSLLNKDLAIELVKAGIDEIYVNDYTKNSVILDRLLGILSDRKDERHFTFEKRSFKEKLSNRAGNIQLYDCLRESIKLPCVKPFRQMFITYNGQTILCCQDWQFTQIMGDSSKERLLDIWFNGNYRRIRQDLKDSNRANNSLCAKCDFSGLW